MLGADFYYELGVQIVEACLTTRPFTGGLLEMGRLHWHVQRRRGSAADPIRCSCGDSGIS